LRLDNVYDKFYSKKKINKFFSSAIFGNDRQNCHVGVKNLVAILGKIADLPTERDFLAHIMDTQPALENWECDKY